MQNYFKHLCFPLSEALKHLATISLSDSLSQIE